MTFDFPRTLGQGAAVERLRQALARERFPHALLVHGEPGLGQHALLLDLAQILVCEDAAVRPCGRCFSCRSFDAASLETVHHLIPVVKADRKGGGDSESADEDGPESDQLEERGESIARWHANPYAYDVPEKAMVRMSQARELIGRLRYSSDAARARVVLVPWLESLGPETANALLKTLEEPPAGVYFLIASDRRSGLMQTLLSRCLQVGLSPLPDADLRAAAETLAARAGRTPDARLLPDAEGSPGAYLALLEDDGGELLEEALRFLAAASADWRVFADYAAGIAPGAEGLERTARLLEFLLRLLRAAQVLRHAHFDVFADAGEGDTDGYRGTAAALAAAGWDAALAAPLGAFEDIADPRAFATFLEEAHRAVRAYSKPSIALTGLFFEYEERAATLRPQGAAA